MFILFSDCGGFIKVGGGVWQTHIVPQKMSHAKRHATSSRYIKIHLKFLADFSMDQRLQESSPVIRNFNIGVFDTNSCAAGNPIQDVELCREAAAFFGEVAWQSQRVAGLQRLSNAWWMIRLMIIINICYLLYCYIYLMAVPRCRYNPLFMVQEGLWWFVLIGYNWITQQGTNSGVPVVPHKAVAKVSKIQKPIGEFGCCESWMAERTCWWIERWLECRAIYLSFYLSICVSICLSICLSISFHPSIFLSVYLSVCLSLYLSVYLSVYRSVCLSLYLYFCLPICLSICLSIYMSIC